MLREAAQRICDSSRISDIVGRYGGEEFVVLLPETDGREAVAAADKLRALLGATPVAAGGDEHRDPREHRRRLLGRRACGRRATSTPPRTEALYRAKVLGRDRTELHDPLVALP